MAKKIVRSDERKSIFGLQINGNVFFTSAILIIIAIALTLSYKERASEFFTKTQDLISTKTGWFFILTMNVFLVFMIYIAFSKYGKMRIGGSKAKPEFSTGSWLAMLFSAGMGIGLLFWGVAEPVVHFTNPPIEGATQIETARKAMNLTFLHYGFHAWAVYALVGLSLAYFTFTKGLPLTIRTVFYPFLGDKIYTWIGDLIDIFAVLATIFGLATTLGFGVQQIAAGLGHLFGIDSGVNTQVILIIGITLVATTSVVLGIDKGVKFLSNMNVGIAGLLLIFVLILGPTVFILKAFIQNTGSYLQDLIRLSTWSESYSGGNWQNSWTVFYWAWWIAWSPFVGTFIARISKGRTVREFTISVLIIPTIITFFWITAFGSTAISEIMNGNDSVLKAVNDNVATALFVFFEDFPLSNVLNIIGIVLVASFFVTSSDSGSLVVDSLTSGGKLDAPVAQRIFWAFTEGGVAAVLLLGGGLVALQAATIVTGLPFAILLLIIAYSLHKGLKEDYKSYKRKGDLKQEKRYQELVSEILEKDKENKI